MWNLSTPALDEHALQRRDGILGYPEPPGGAHRPVHGALTDVASAAPAHHRAPLADQRDLLNKGRRGGVKAPLSSAAPRRRIPASAGGEFDLRLTQLGDDLLGAVPLPPHRVPSFPAARLYHSRWSGLRDPSHDRAGVRSKLRDPTPPSLTGWTSGWLKIGMDMRAG